MEKVIRFKVKKKKRINPLKVIAVLAIGLILLVSILAYIGGRDSVVSDGSGIVVSDPIYEAESVDACKESCIGYDAHGFDEGVNHCRCWFDIDESDCESQCDSYGADSFDWYKGFFRSQEDYCRCWFETESSGDANDAFGLLWALLPLLLLVVFGFFLLKVLRFDLW